MPVNFGVLDPRVRLESLADLPALILRKRQQQEAERAALVQEQQHQQQLDDARRHNLEVEADTRNETNRRVQMLGEIISQHQASEAERQGKMVDASQKEVFPLIGAGKLDQANAAAQSAPYFNRQTGQLEYGKVGYKPGYEPSLLPEPAPVAPTPEPQKPQRTIGDLPGGFYDIPQEQLPPEAPAPKDAETPGDIAQWDAYEASQGARYDKARELAGKEAQAEGTYQQAMLPEAVAMRAAANKKKQRDYEAEKTKAIVENERRRDAAPVEVSYPNRPPIETSVFIERRKATDKDANDFERMVTPSLEAARESLALKHADNPALLAQAVGRLERDMAQVRVLGEQIRAGRGLYTVDKAINQFWKNASDEAKFALQDQLGQYRIHAAEALARRPNEMAQTRWAEVAKGADQFDNQQFQQLLGQMSFKGNMADLVKVRNLGNQVAARNVALDKVAIGNWARMAQGAGVLSNQDIEFFWSTIGGKAEGSWQQWWNNYLGHGEMPEAQRAAVTAAAKNLVDERYAQAKDIRRRADALMSGADIYPRLRAAYFMGLPEGEEDDPATGLPPRPSAQTRRSWGSSRKSGPAIPPEAQAKGASQGGSASAELSEFEKKWGITQ